tara:strand:+ start:116 stop:574 length:459 start_codon:yes stop_codon:yes gene_type:complete
MKTLISLTMAIFFFFSTTTLCFAGYYKGDCLSPKGKFKDCKINIENETLNVEFDKRKYGKKSVPGKNITKITGGEYARRRVSEGIGYTILFGPLMLFSLFSKKKRDNFGVEYTNTEGKKEAILIQSKKKYGIALKTELQAISGRDVEMEVKN